MLCKNGGFHGGGYEEWRLLGYKNPVPTSQETHYVSGTESSRLMLCKIGGIHGDDYEECMQSVFCDETFGCCKNRRFGGMYRLHHQGE
jgi:hypothetical protein